MAILNGHKRSADPRRIHPRYWGTSSDTDLDFGVNRLGHHSRFAGNRPRTQAALSLARVLMLESRRQTHDFNVFDVCTGARAKLFALARREDIPGRSALKRELPIRAGIQRPWLVRKINRMARSKRDSLRFPTTTCAPDHRGLRRRIIFRRRSCSRGVGTVASGRADHSVRPIVITITPQTIYLCLRDAYRMLLAA